MVTGQERKQARTTNFIKTGEVKEQSEIFDEFGISPNLIESLLRREQDDEGHFLYHLGRSNGKLMNVFFRKTFV